MPGCAGSARRAKRYPVVSLTGAVVAARRLRCDARSGVASQNSLRALRALRSNNRDEHDHEARCARRPQACASRRPTQRPHRVPPGAQTSSLTSGRTPPRCLQRPVRAGRGAPVQRRGAQGLRPRAQRESSSNSARLSERSARKARSEFRDGPQGRAPQGSRRAAATAAPKRRGLPGRAFAARSSLRKADFEFQLRAVTGRSKHPAGKRTAFRRPCCREAGLAPALPQ